MDRSMSGMIFSEEYIKLLQSTEMNESDRNPIFPQTLAKAVYLDINGETYNLQNAITLGLLQSSLKVEVVTVTAVTTSVSIPSSMEIKDIDQLIIFQNGLLLNKDINYTLNNDKTSITLVDYSTRKNDIFTFMYLPYIVDLKEDSGISGEITMPITNVIAPSSTDAQVPTAKAVYTYINGLVNGSY